MKRQTSEKLIRATKALICELDTHTVHTGECGLMQERIKKAREAIAECEEENDANRRVRVR